MRYDELIPVLIHAIQELDEQFSNCSSAQEIHFGESVGRRLRNGGVNLDIEKDSDSLADKIKELRSIDVKLADTFVAHMAKRDILSSRKIELKMKYENLQRLNSKLEERLAVLEAYFLSQKDINY